MAKTGISPNSSEITADEQKSGANYGAGSLAAASKVRTTGRVFLTVIARSAFRSTENAAIASHHRQC